MVGQMLMLQGAHGSAREHLRHSLMLGQRMPSALLEFHALLALSWSHFADGESAEGLTHLRHALDIGARHNVKNSPPLWLPTVMSSLSARALQAGIEPDYVKRLIRARGLRPESPEIDAWPWPIRI